jgi:uncharacterized protein (DUF4415 family)
MKAEAIFSRPLSPKEKVMLKRLRSKPDSEIDFSDIPELTDAQLAQFRRAPKVLVAARIDREVYDWLQQYGSGYSTRINHILRAVMLQAK